MGDILSIKIRNSAKKHSIEYLNEIDLSNPDPNRVLQILIDLESFGIPLKKVISLYQRDRKDVFPF